MTPLLTGFAFGIEAFLFISLPYLFGWGRVSLWETAMDDKESDTLLFIGWLLIECGLIGLIVFLVAL